ncbi:MAG: hypothetical protein AAGF01_26305 [Cyanobacteria bacterium P01_G01_bin.38]
MLQQQACIPKSSVHRHKQALKQRHQYPESLLWDTSAGEQWLNRLVVAAIYVFEIKRGVGVDETWFEQTILAMIELGSGYLLI